ncbi:DUF962 domain-containing protein [Neisseriaceae bacterium PsAf]|nr:DUF962 domain-containing protein [Neisseriaceae bacterium PsAf]MCV2503118.1 DUF962 domain-containing protein [Neisseriaceae bacterium]
MKTLTDWFIEYSQSHQNPRNKNLHMIFVPLIYFSIIGMGMNISTWITYLALILLFVYYFSLDKPLAWGMLVVTFAWLFIMQFIHRGFFFYLVIFIIAWVGQFYGHKLEGKKPAFLSDLTYLVIGPLWVLDYLLRTYQKHTIH